jgi:glycine cleavage system H protein
MNFPANLKYTKEHEWILIEGNKAKIGITDFAQKELGDIVYLDINTQGKKVAQNEIFGTIEAVKTFRTYICPLQVLS